MSFGTWTAIALILLAGSVSSATSNKNSDSAPAQVQPPSPEDFRPTGAAGPSTIAPALPPGPTDDFFPLPDRWRIGFPDNYIQDTRNDTLFNPYGQNLLKGDYPIIGQNTFLILTATSDALIEARRSPLSNNVRGSDSLFLQENLVLSADLFSGDTAFQPRDWEIRATGVGNVNYTQVSSPTVDENGSHPAVQELFVDKRLADLSVNYDILSLRAGIQGFTSDFRGFLFSSNEPGVRLYGNYDNNRLQYNLAWFSPVQKDRVSLLNTLNTRNQNVFIANLYRQDFLFDGYTAQIEFAADLDRGGKQFDLQTSRRGQTSAYYLGWAGDGHVGPVNITHQFYQALGRQSFNPIAGRDLSINARFAAVELSYDVDYVRLRASFAYASGDHNPRNGAATGFDSIFDNPNFAGGGFNYLTRQAIALTGTGLNLVNRNSFLPDLRPSKGSGQANFVNPGLLLYNLGADINVTPTLTLIGNASYLMFDNTSSLELLTNRPHIGSSIGVDVSLGVQYRPLLNNNIILTAGAAGLAPGSGFSTLYSSNLLYSFFTGITVTY